MFAREDMGLGHGGHLKNLYWKISMWAAFVLIVGVGGHTVSAGETQIKREDERGLLSNTASPVRHG